MDTGRHKQLRIITPVGLIILCAILYTNVENRTSRNLVINEVAFSQTNSEDWIEIYNPTLNNLSLSNLYISDKAAELDKYKFPDGLVIPSHEYLIINTQNFEGDSDDPQTNFNISLGETIYLIDKDGSTIIDQLPVLSSDESVSNKTIGRYPDGSTDIFLMGTSTPNDSNIKDTEL